MGISWKLVGEEDGGEARHRRRGRICDQALRKGALKNLYMRIATLCLAMLTRVRYEFCKRT